MMGTCHGNIVNGYQEDTSSQGYDMDCFTRNSGEMYHVHGMVFFDRDTNRMGYDIHTVPFHVRVPAKRVSCIGWEHGRFMNTSPTIHQPTKDFWLRMGPSELPF